MAAAPAQRPLHCHLLDIIDQHGTSAVHCLLPTEDQTRRLISRLTIHKLVAKSKKSSVSNQPDWWRLRSWRVTGSHVVVIAYCFSETTRHLGITHLHKDLRPTYEDLSQVSGEQIGSCTTMWKNLSMWEGGARERGPAGASSCQRQATSPRSVCGSCLAPDVATCSKNWSEWLCKGNIVHVPDICHRRHGYTRVNFFWPV